MQAFGLRYARRHTGWDIRLSDPDLPISSVFSTSLHGERFGGMTMFRYENFLLESIGGDLDPTLTTQLIIINY